MLNVEKKFIKNLRKWFKHNFSNFHVEPCFEASRNFEIYVSIEFVRSF